MPPLPSVPNTARVRQEFTLGDGRKGFCVHHYQWTGGPAASADMVDLATNVRSVYTGFWLPHMDPGLSVGFTDAVDLSNPSGAGGSVIGNNAGGGGGNSNDSLAVVVKWVIARRYKGGKPKSYLPGAADMLSLEANGVSTATRNGADTWAVHMLSDPAAGSYPNITAPKLVMVSYYSGFHNVTLPSGRQVSRPTLRSTPQIDPITGHTTNLIYGHQRRRSTTF